MDKELRFWQNVGNSLFLITNSQPMHMTWVGISRIEWLTGDPRIEPTKTTIVLQGQIPAANELFGLQNGASLEVLHYEYGDYTRYEIDNVIARFTNCEIVDNWIEDFVTNNPDLSQLVTLCVRLNVDFEVLVDDH